MNKKIIILILFFLSFNFSSYSATFNWTKVNQSNDETFELYYDKKTVLSTGRYFFYWQLLNYKKKQDNNILSLITHNMVNCETSEIKVISYTDFKDNMGKGSSDFEMIVPENEPESFKWIYYDINTTIQGQVIKSVCN